MAVELISDDVLDAMQRRVVAAPALVEGAYRRQVVRVRPKLLSKLRAYPGAPKYPLRWKSARQRRAFFATNGFGGGIPYQRTGKLGAGWNIDITPLAEGGQVVLSNTQSYMPFVQGDSTQPFHLDTGWPQMGPIVAEIRQELDDRLVETWFTLTDPTAGVPR